MSDVKTVERETGDSGARAGVVYLCDVRMIYPSLFEPHVFNDQVGKYQASFLISKEDKGLVQRVKGVLHQVYTEGGGKVSPGSRRLLPEDRNCFRDGDLMERNEYEGHYFLRSKSRRRPVAIGRDKEPLEESHGLLVSGCYVNAVVSFWYMNGQFGQRLGSTLEAVQYLRDGPHFGSMSVNAMEYFDVLEDGKSSDGESSDGVSGLEDDIPF